MRGWSRAAVGAAAVGVLAACALGTWLQLRHWQDDETVWQHALAVTPRNAVTHFHMGTVLYRRERIAEAEEHFAEALRLNPNFTLALNNLGVSYRRQGKLPEALALLRRAEVLEPRSPVVRNQLGLALVQQGNGDEAVQCFREAVRLAPAEAEYHCNLATALAEQGHRTEARGEYDAGLRLDPAWPQKADAVAQVLLRANNPRLRCPAEALFRARQACQATGESRSELLDTLADAYSRNGRQAEAVATARKALELASAAGQEKVARHLQGQLALYETLLAEQQRARKPK